MFVDTYILKIKPEFEMISDFDKIINMIPDEYKIMFGKLWNEYQNLEDILRTENIENILNLDFIKEFESQNIFFTRRFREQCLQKILRELFFDTLIIFKNTVNPKNYNYYDIYTKDHKIIIGMFLEPEAEEILANSMLAIGATDVYASELNDLINIEQLVQPTEEELDIKKEVFMNNPEDNRLKIS